MRHVAEGMITATVAIIVSGFFLVVVGGKVGIILAAALPYLVCVGLSALFEETERKSATMIDTSD